MKLRDIYILCKQNVAAIEDIRTVRSGDTIHNDDVKNLDIKIQVDYKYFINTPKDMELKIDRLKEVKCLDAEISQFLGIIHSKNENPILLYENEYKAFSLAKKELLSCINCIINLYEMMGLEKEEIIGLDIKLPITRNFSDFRKNIDDLEFIFTKCPFFQHESESLEFQNVDIGSSWLTFVIIGIGVTAGSILINNIAAFIDKCMIIRSHHKTIQQQIFDIEKDEEEADNKEILIKYLNKAYKKTVDTAIKELEESTNHKLLDGEEIGRTEQAFERLERLFDKGLQIYSTIDSPAEAKALFEPLEMKYLEIDKQLKLLEKKDDEQNND